MNNFDSIIVGGGHAGVEAAYSHAKANLNTLLITQNIETLGQLSCNPSMGGIGKSNLIKEIDILGGIIGKISDLASIQANILNYSKGLSSRVLRVQLDRYTYKKYIIKFLSKKHKLTIIQQDVNKFLIDNYIIKGIETNLGIKLYSKIVILTAGTFLNGRICVGYSYYEGGRLNDSASQNLAKQLKKLPFKNGRLKTGTPPRLDKKIIDFFLLKKQYVIENLYYINFSVNYKKYHKLKKLSCYQTNTNKNTHNIILKNLNASIIYSNIINSIGPRYCPSIEDKIIRFSNKDSHFIFLEPEGIHNFESYPNGISTALPFYVQLKLIRTIIGLKNTNLTRVGYAVEYDFFDPRDLKTSLETKYIKNLFFAGQINGTTGYEEAAAQGIVAGINSLLMIKNKKPFFLQKKLSYIGFLIYNLTTIGIIEPYRIFASDIENRLEIRDDTIKNRFYNTIKQLKNMNSKIIQNIRNTIIIINTYNKLFIKKLILQKNIKNLLINNITNNKIINKISIFSLIKRPTINIILLNKVYNLSILIIIILKFNIQLLIETKIKYSSYNIKII